ncbi:structural maintenance of chromosomes protein 5 [Ceratina calcarata]|uniref:Structural maintenance of chromosomes protein 5 n=1 Tax=Ceratina calcarata TaxID=156304 RepID=A0AAJ7N9B0_9HYME|nr:structural maintenance of chromosomes protein 5 [Ceratina calcarata]
MADGCVDTGMITHIYLENFVTYSKVSVKPGRYLNVIIGPNGTGKSTIVCAIVLGLGGKPSTIGRATQIGHYVKYGCQEATIEIHLKNKKQNDNIIRRVFNKQGKSSWFLNKKPSNIKEIQELTTSLDIQVDNLCQFLPQDKVQDFSKMNPQELLENTERSVGDPVILEHHKRLIQSRVDHKELEKHIEVKKKALETQTQVYESLKETVDSIKEKKLIKKKITALKQKKAWILYEQKRKELLKLKKKKVAATSELKRMEEEIKPFEDVIEKLKSKVELLKSSVSNHNNKLKTETAKLANMINDIADCDSAIIDRENVCKKRIQMEETRDRDIKVAEQSKSKLDNDLLLMLEETGSEESLAAKQQEILSKIEDKNGTITMLTKKMTMLKRQEQRTDFEIEAQQSEQQRLSVEAKRLKLLREKSSDTYRAVHWLRENRDKFCSTIHEPILLNLNVKDAKYAKYLENVLPYRDLIAFVCEDKRDMNNLLNYLRTGQNLQVNVVYSDPTKHVSTEPNIPLRHIVQFGFTHYLVSLIEAPSTILKYLVNMYNLSNIPIGTAQVDDNTENIPTSLHLYFSQSNVYSVKTSKYTGVRSVTMQPISTTGMLSAVLDRSKLLHIEESLRSLRETKANVLNEIQKINEEMREHNNELDKYKTEKNEHQQDLQQIQVLKSRISVMKKKIADLQNARTSIEKIQESSREDIKLILEKEFKIYKEYNAVLKQCFKYTTTSEQAELTINMHKRLLRVKGNELQDMRGKLKEAEDYVRRLSQEAQPMKSEAERLYKDALETTHNITPSDKAFEQINKIFTKLPPTIEEINKELNIAQAKVFCLGNSGDGENILQQYEEVEENIGHLKDFIQRKTNEYATLTQDIKSLQEQWLTALSAIVEKINSNFGMYFSAMGCAGEVTLAVPENNVDFERYGLKIMVKFRDTDKLQELTRHHQSGGERAVTTAIYMISLQELSRVPFRCVDEINQGMDATNERRVFNLLVKMTGRPNSPQYFLLTPKLLPNLEYAETVTVHCVYNGPFMIAHEAFDTEQYCRRLIKEKEKEI